ncbi:sensor histidine kinase [Neorhizobium petrolearium]|uniref:Sensor histidine kinase n=1 Tax=Neorhizobium petrolearium TaxID=515361 RepID=A0ABY8M2G9_9HYPH|nr:sensor histidine kinase [Neorhizobium petrolearium]MCC2608474.1 sensor histidine kinase [Neorhizobium petrolearium]WGI68745.1 sensor histidine kinase [Neorhizobium petrolearium]
MPLRGILDRWNNQSLARQFLIAGGLVSLAAMMLVGAYVTTLIEAAVTRNSAASTALYVDSIIAPLLPDMKTSQRLDDVTTRALDETFGQGALGGKVVSFRLWRKDGTVLYATPDKSIVGKRLDPGEDLLTAFSGQMVAQFGFADPQDASERSRDDPLLEIYNPILQPWSGEVVAVSEFYEVADEFQQSLHQAQLRSWLAVFGVTLAFFLLLSAIVFRGSRIIDHQQQALTQRVTELSELLSQNKALHAKAQRASLRATALNESYLRRLGADLHDGPAQLVAYAALRVDSRLLTDPRTPHQAREKEVSTIKARLDEAMDEIRSICSGLVLPQIETAELPDVLKRAVDAHRQRTGLDVALSMTNGSKSLPPSAKICIYRFVQEALNNGFRHGGGVDQSVRQTFDNGNVVIEVADHGPGFDPASVGPDGLGLAGLRERIESLGGTFNIFTSKSGTTVRMSLNVQEMEQA